MSIETLTAEGRHQESSHLDTIDAQTKLTRCANASPAAATGRVQKVWCAPMTDSGQWVITWTRAAGALTYEVQTSLDASEWSSSCNFLGTRAVLLVGPAPRCWARVRAFGPAGPGAWSEPAIGERAKRLPAAA